MKFRIEQRFAGGLDEVEELLLDPEFLDRLGRLPKLGAPTLVHEVDAGPLLHRWIKFRFTGEVNAAVRRVVDPKRLTWVEESTLTRATHRTTWRIVPDHYPAMIRASGSFQLAADGPTATIRTTEGEIRVNVPLVGGKVERAIVSGLEDHAAAEVDVIDAWLRERSERSP